jgi:hypothetical protein
MAWQPHVRAAVGRGGAWSAEGGAGMQHCNMKHGHAAADGLRNTRRCHGTCSMQRWRRVVVAPVEARCGDGAQRHFRPRFGRPLCCAHRPQPSTCGGCSGAAECCRPCRRRCRVRMWAGPGVDVGRSWCGCGPVCGLLFFAGSPPGLSVGLDRFPDSLLRAAAQRRRRCAAGADACGGRLRRVCSAREASEAAGRSNSECSHSALSAPVPPPPAAPAPQVHPASHAPSALPCDCSAVFISPSPS